MLAIHRKRLLGVATIAAAWALGAAISVLSARVYAAPSPSVPSAVQDVNDHITMPLALPRTSDS